MAEVIGPLVGNRGCTAKNSKEIIANVPGMDIAPEDVMISFDVETLCTSLPIDRILKYTQRRLESDNMLGERTSLNVEEILQLLEYCLQSTFFSFKGEFYYPADGVAMRSPILLVVANLFMEELEEEAMKIAKQKGFAPRSWDRYADDVFSVIKKSNVESILEHLNKQDPNIRFTTEEEQNNELPFWTFD